MRQQPLRAGRRAPALAPCPALLSACRGFIASASLDLPGAACKPPGPLPLLAARAVSPFEPDPNAHSAPRRQRAPAGQRQPIQQWPSGSSGRAGLPGGGRCPAPCRRLASTPDAAFVIDLGRASPGHRHSGAGRYWPGPRTCTLQCNRARQLIPVLLCCPGPSGQTWRRVLPPLPRALLLLLPPALAPLLPICAGAGAACREGEHTRACSPAAGSIDRPAAGGGNACGSAAARAALFVRTSVHELSLQF